MDEQQTKFDTRKSLYADLSLLLVALFWGGGFVIIKDALNDLTPLWLMALRFSFAFILMGIVFYKNLLRISKKDLLSGCLIGIFLYAAYATQTVGLQYTTVGKSAFITGVNVVIVPFIYMVVMRKSPGWFSFAGAILAVIGLGLLTLTDGFAMQWGDTLTLFGAFFFAAHIFTVGYFAPDADAIGLSIIQTGAAAIFLLLSALIAEPIPKAIPVSAWTAIGYTVLFSTIGAVLIQNIAQQYTPSTHAAIILCLESVFGAVLGVIFIPGEYFTTRMIIGCVLIFMGIITTETKLSFLWRKEPPLNANGI
jgi:drug/metabolite transporter (DMT)-like permease